ncbi:coiled-coil domain-containing protein 174 [Plakobranchus ocellatus]|uniref:Coiled-coil domain-containing protein 174 n=1 Tax=Plakobranchus ocellatus TaxID=259542 RepID=A0AAV3ZX86_9GAST|nr:coiled-coil domain-containing protein 174 [Plakobranchus ocellatus]
MATTALSYRAVSPDLAEFANVRPSVWANMSLNDILWQQDRVSMNRAANMVRGKQATCREIDNMEEGGKDRKPLSSSMVDLKAELFRKQEEFKKQKEANASFIRPVKINKEKKGSIWSKQNPGVSARAQRDLDTRETNVEEEEMLAKSRRILEQKSRIYDSFTNSSSIPDEDGSEYYLVDFQKKAIDAIVEEREVKRNADKRREEEEEEAERKALAEEIPEPSCPDEEWVDFVDSLGRDRRCMKKDLNQLMKKDQELAVAQANKKKSSSKAMSSIHPERMGHSKDEQEKEAPPAPPDLMSPDMHREMMRQKWEDEAREMMDRGQDEVHYSNVQFDEIRAHGVGYYQFSKDHVKREEELERLQKLREETKDQQSRKDSIKDKRKAMMEARLAKVRQRRKLKEEVTQEDKKDPDEEDTDSIGPKLSEADSSAQTKEEEKRKQEEIEAAEEKRREHIREWDKEKMKDNTWGVKAYLSARREERESEFAPPSIYFDQKTNMPKLSTPRNVLSHKDRLKRLQGSISSTSPQIEGAETNEVTDQGKSNEGGCPSASRYDNKPPGAKGSVPVDSIPLPRGPVEEDVPVEHRNQSSRDMYGDQHQTSSDSRHMERVSQHAADVLQYQQHQAGPQLLQYQYQGRLPSQHWGHHAQENTLAQQHYCSGQESAMPQHWNPAIGSENSLQQSHGGETSHPSQTWNPAQPTHNLPYHPVSAANYYQDSTPVQANNTYVPSSQPTSPASLCPPTSSTQNPPEHDKPPAAKKAKVPKLSIVDYRYVNNFDTSSINPEPGRVPDVGGIPYKPGTFSKYNPQGLSGTPSSRTEEGEEKGETKETAQISGGPLIYTKEQLQRQQQELDEQMGVDSSRAAADDDDGDRKLQEFLSSIRASTT